METPHKKICLILSNYFTAVCVKFVVRAGRLFSPETLANFLKQEFPLMQLTIIFTVFHAKAMLAKNFLYTCGLWNNR